MLGDNPATGSHLTGAMTEALQRHEEKLDKLTVLSKLQDHDFKMQLDVRNDVARLEKEEKRLRKTKLQEELRQ